MNGRSGHRSWQVVKWKKPLLPREQRILRLRDNGQTLQEIGEQFGLSAERIRQIEWQARKKLSRSG